MDLKIADLTTLDVDDVAARQAILTQLLSEAFPTIDFRRGEVHDTVLHLASVLSVGVDANIDAWEKSHTLANLLEDPTAATDALVDQRMQDYRITRRAATAATGNVTIVVSQLAATNVPAGAQFISNGVTFATTTPIAARISQATVQSSTDRVLTPIGNGQYLFNVPVQALTPGAVGLVRRNAAMTPQFSLQFYVTSYAEADFLGGLDGDTNADLAQRAETGIAAKAWSNRTNIQALVRSQPEFASVVHLSIIGATNPEMRRDRRGPLPISFGGRSDVYIRTRLLPSLVTLNKTCTLVEKQLDGYGVWQCSLTRDDAPGFYRVEKINLATDRVSTGFAVQSDERSLNFTGTGPFPDVQGSEGVYSPYQTATITFVDTTTQVAALTVGVSTGAYVLAVSAMPQLAELQDFLWDYDTTDPTGDVLVKAPIPCFVQLDLNIYLPSQTSWTSAQSASVAAALAERVNRQDFTGALFASDLTNVVYDFLPTGGTVSSIEMFGRIRLPSGTYKNVRDREVLRIPSLPEAFLSGRTCCFYLDPDAISLGVSRLGLPG